MRPTIEEQLDGTRRLLQQAESTPQLPSDARTHIRNAARLVDRVAASWLGATAFLVEDNRRLAALLGADEAEPAAHAEGSTHGLADVAARNESLRAQLCTRIRDLSPGPERDAIGRYLRSRVDTDPT